MLKHVWTKIVKMDEENIIPSIGFGAGVSVMSSVVQCSLNYFELSYMMCYFPRYALITLI